MGDTGALRAGGVPPRDSEGPNSGLLALFALSSGAEAQRAWPFWSCAVLGCMKCRFGAEGATS